MGYEEVNADWQLVILYFQTCPGSRRSCARFGVKYPNCRTFTSGSSLSLQPSTLSDKPIKARVISESPDGRANLVHCVGGTNKSFPTEVDSSCNTHGTPKQSWNAVYLILVNVRTSDLNKTEPLLEAKSLMSAVLPQGSGLWLQTSQTCVSRGTGPRRQIRLQSFGKPIHVALIGTSGQRKFLGLESENSRRTRLAVTPNDDKQERGQVADEDVNKSEQRKGLVEKIEEEMGRQFGGVLWFTVLLVCLAVFGGSYAYCIVNFASFDDVPMLRGTAR